jgi:hypothetical protein
MAASVSPARKSAASLECLPARGRRWRRGYAQFLDALADPRHEEHDSSVVWVGYLFDPAAFSLGAIKAALPRVR